MIGGAGEDLGVHMEAGVGVREVAPGGVAGVGVGAGVVVGVFEDLVEEAIHRTACGRVAHIMAGENLRIGEIELGFLHDRDRGRRKTIFLRSKTHPATKNPNFGHKFYGLWGKLLQLQTPKKKGIFHANRK